MFFNPDCSLSGFYSPVHDVSFTVLSHILEESDIKAAAAALSFILSSAAKHAVDGDSLNNELQQLGLPKGKACQ